MATDIGQAKMSAQLKAIRNAMVRETMFAVDNTCQNIETYAKLTHGIQGGKRERPGKQVFQNQTGNLEASIHHGTPVLTGNIITANVIADMPYAEAIELGSSTNAHYPFLKPSVEANAKTLSIELGMALQRAKGGV